MADFVNGIKAFKPHEKAPEFVKANFSFKKSELLAFLKDQPEEFRAVMKESKNGGYYLAIDTYQPKAETPRANYSDDSLPF